MKNHDLLLEKIQFLKHLRSERDINKIWIAEGSAARTNATSNEIWQKKQMYCPNCTKEKN